MGGGYWRRLPPASPLPVKRRGVRRAEALSCQRLRRRRRLHLSLHCFALVGHQLVPIAVGIVEIERPRDPLVNEVAACNALPFFIDERKLFQTIQELQEGLPIDTERGTGQPNGR